MSAIPDELIERIRDAADIVEVVGEHVDLRRTGADYRGPCPFHGGTKRNFAVIPKKQMFYCFVCHEGGDVFTFYMKGQGMDYPRAVREVARRVGIEIPERSTGGPDPREPLFSAVAVAGEWYAHRLRDAPDAARARDYLVGRGFDLDTLLPLGLGFAPKGGVFLEAMSGLGITEDVLLQAGLAVKREEDGSLRPRFWGRLLFPIHDLRGRVVGFGGRVLGDGEPKYLNSPDSPIFHKGQLLYNLHAAKHAIRKEGRAIAVEGYFDVLRAVEAGVENVVAALGTAFTPDQAKLLGRYATETVLLYDSDQAGMRASFRTAAELLRVSMRTLIATPPPNEDPDSLVRRGGREALAGVIDDAIDVLERQLQLLERRGWLADLSGRRRALDRLLPTLRAAADPVTADLYVDRTAEALGINPESVRREMESGRRGPPRPLRPQAAPADESPSLGGGRPERRLVEIMVREPDCRSRIAEVWPEAARLTAAEREVFEQLRAAPDLSDSELITRVDAAGQALVAGILQQPWGGPEEFDVHAVIDGALRKIDARARGNETRELLRRLPVTQDAEEKDAILRTIYTRKKRDLSTPSS